MLLLHTCAYGIYFISTHMSCPQNANRDRPADEGKKTTKTATGVIRKLRRTPLPQSNFGVSRGGERFLSPPPPLPTPAICPYTYTPTVQLSRSLTSHVTISARYVRLFPPPQKFPCKGKGEGALTRLLLLLPFSLPAGKGG